MTETIQRATQAIIEKAKERHLYLAGVEALPLATACLETLLDPSEEAAPALLRAAQARYAAWRETRAAEGILCGPWEALPVEGIDSLIIEERAAIRAYHMTILGREE